MVSSVLVLVSSMVTLVCCASIYNRNKVIEMAENLPCKNPQPRAFTIAELTNMALEFVDPFVVLYRCDRAGCCDRKDETCTPVVKENVTISVGYYDYSDEEETFDLTAENHIKCECRKSVSSIK